MNIGKVIGYAQLCMEKAGELSRVQDRYYDALAELNDEEREMVKDELITLLKETVQKEIEAKARAKRMGI